MLCQPEENGKNGWQLSKSREDGKVVFKKGNMYVVWDSRTQLIDDQYEYEVV
jgi:hypothetical protein